MKRAVATGNSRLTFTPTNRASVLSAKVPCGNLTLSWEKMLLPPADDKLRVLFLMHVDVRWIKQRPHFLAEKLSDVFNVTIAYSRANRRRALLRSDDLGATRWPVFRFPARWNPVSWALDRVMLAIQYIFLFLIVRPHVIVIPFPDMMSKIVTFSKAAIIYDCMDDAVAFFSHRGLRQRLGVAERALCRAATSIIASSSHLARTLETRYGIQGVRIIRNAFNGHILEPTAVQAATPSGRALRLGYFGTISHWFDFEALETALEATGSECHVVGPLEVEFPVSKRIQYHGVLPHSELPNFSRTVDVLIMPFIVSDLISSVDPVKIYEYINFDKPIICVQYPEINRFEKFCFFYSDVPGLGKAIETARQGKKYSEQDRQEFLSFNSWQNRVDDLAQVIRNACLHRAGDKPIG